MPKKQLDQDDLFIRMSNPNTLRRNILESSKLVLTTLKQTYRVKQIRELKQERIEILSKEIKELRILVQKIEELMPQYTKADIKRILPDLPIFRKPVPEPPKPAPPPESQPEAKPEEKPQPEPTKPKPAHPPPKPVSEIDRITKALEDVQRKLSML